MKCTHCREEILGPNMVEGGFCSALCCAAKEHEDRLHQNEHMTIHVSSLDDGGYTVEIKMRDEDGFNEMTKNYEEYGDALRGISELCLSVADQMKEAE